MRALLLAVASSLAPIALKGQEASDPRAVCPERPAVAIHAWTVEPRYGAIVHLRGPQPDALYVGMVYNLGRLLEQRAG